jgi:hypothetical protein
MCNYCAGLHLWRSAAINVGECLQKGFGNCVRITSILMMSVVIVKVECVTYAKGKALQKAVDIDPQVRDSNPLFAFLSSSSSLFGP